MEQVLREARVDLACGYEQIFQFDIAAYNSYISPCDSISHSCQPTSLSQCQERPQATPVLPISSKAKLIYSHERCKIQISSLSSSRRRGLFLTGQLPCSNSRGLHICRCHTEELAGFCRLISSGSLVYYLDAVARVVWSCQGLAAASPMAADDL